MRALAALVAKSGVDQPDGDRSWLSPDGTHRRLTSEAGKHLPSQAAPGAAEP